MAADIFTYNRTLSRQSDYTDTLIEASNYQLVLLKHFKNSHKTPVKAYERDTEMESDIAPGIVRIHEGQQKDDSSKSYDNDLIKSVTEEANSNGWHITRQADEFKGMRLVQNLVADAKMKDVDALMYGIECVLGSNQECVLKTSVETITKTRGLLNWLQPTAHTAAPFNERHLPAGEITLGSDALTEDEFKSMLKRARIKSKRALNLYGFVGPQLQSMFVDFLIMVQANRNLTRNIDFRETGIYQNVDYLNYEGNTVTLMGLDTLARNTTTLDKDATSDYAGAFFELDKFDLEWLNKPRHESITHLLKGGGQAGFFNAAYRLGARCLTSGFRIMKTA